MLYFLYHDSFFFSSRRRHTRSLRDWSSDVCSSDLLTSATSSSGTAIHGATGMETLWWWMWRTSTIKPGSTPPGIITAPRRSEERRVGKECRSRCLPHHYEY